MDLESLTQIGVIVAIEIATVARLILHSEGIVHRHELACSFFALAVSRLVLPLPHLESHSDESTVVTATFLRLLLHLFVLGEREAGFTLEGTTVELGHWFTDHLLLNLFSEISGQFLLQFTFNSDVTTQ